MTLGVKRLRYDASCQHISVLAVTPTIQPRGCHVMYTYCTLLPTRCVLATAVTLLRHVYCNLPSISDSFYRSSRILHPVTQFADVAIEMYLLCSLKMAPLRDATCLIHNFHIRTVHLDIISVLFINQLMHQRVAFKKSILKFTLKQLRHVSVLKLHHHQGAH